MEKKSKKIYLGLDIGTDSVGYAVTDDQYNLLRVHGDDAWGSVIFDAASLSDERRSHRSARRRLDRRQQRINLLQEIFAKEISKVDDRFFIRLSESYRWREDVQDRYVFFNDEEYTDVQYMGEYPTIHHLICELMNNKNPHDVRLIYLACAWLITHRGHFLNNLNVEKLDEIMDISSVYQNFINYFTENGYRRPWGEIDVSALAEVLKQKTGVTVKNKELQNILLEGKNPEKVCAKYQFASYSVFSNAFRKEYGVVPAKYYRMEFQNIAWINYIDEHITEDITPEMMAEHFNYSRDYFRKAFQDDFGMGLSAYISQRKIQKAARELRQGVKVASLAKKYGFKSRNGFDKAFRKAFCTSPSKYAKANTEVVDLNQFYSEYKDKMKVSFMDVDDIKMVGWTIIPNRGREVDIPAQVAFWLDEDSPYFKKMNSVAGSANGNDKIAMWYHDPECINIQYVLGPVVNNFTNVPDDAVKIEIAAGRFAVFETDRESDVDNLADTIRMFSRCVFYGWIKEHRDMVSLQNFTFERYINKKVYIYVPISVK